MKFVPPEREDYNSVLFFGSTGFLGRLTLKNFLDPDFHLSYLKNLIRNETSVNVTDNLVNGNIKWNKVIYCVNRRPQILEFFNENTMDNVNEDLIINNNVAYKLDRCFAHGSKIKKSQENGQIKNPYIDVPMAYTVQQDDYNLIYLSTETGGKIVIDLKITVFHLCLPDSKLWAEQLPELFSSATSLARIVRTKTSDDPDSDVVLAKSEYQLPQSMDHLPTMVYTLGFSYHNAKTESAKMIDYEFTKNLVNSFNSSEKKRLVIVTSFNNKLISTLLEYFSVKQKIEDELSGKICPRVQDLILIKPGPIAGSPMTDAITPGYNPILQYSSNYIVQLFYYKKYLIDYQLAILRKIHGSSLASRASEFIAGTMYGKPGSSLLGYCIPGTKVAQAIGFNALHEPRIPDTSKPSVRRVCSKVMDKMY